MKKISVIILILLFVLLSIFKVNAYDSTFPLIGKTIVLDAGHGGKDLGASVLNVSESKINLSITLRLKEELERKGANVILTRSDENDLSSPNALYRKKSDFDNRIKLINNSHADLYLSIHQNIFSNAKYHGPQVFYYPKITDNEKIASVIQDELNKFTNSNRKIKIITGTYMYNKLNIKGALIECGFLSNSAERMNLTNEEYQNNIAQSISKAINSYFS